MKAFYLFVSLLAFILASIEVSASPFGEGVFDRVEPSRAPDPPPFPTPLPQSQDGVLQDLSIINYTPNNPSNRQHSCWTSPRSRPDPTHPYDKGICSVCVVRRKRTDGGADYQVWARDNENNAMGNMPVTSVWRLDDMGLDQTTAEDTPAVLMGGSHLQLWAMSAEDPSYSVIHLRWATPPYNISLPVVDSAVPQVMFDLSPTINAGDNCVFAGRATNGEVVYLICFFSC